MRAWCCCSERYSGRNRTHPPLRTGVAEPCGCRCSTATGLAASHITWSIAPKPRIISAMASSVCRRVCVSAARAVSQLVEQEEREIKAWMAAETCFSWHPSACLQSRPRLSMPCAGIGLRTSSVATGMDNGRLNRAVKSREGRGAEGGEAAGIGATAAGAGVAAIAVAGMEGVANERAFAAAAAWASGDPGRPEAVEGKAACRTGRGDSKRTSPFSYISTSAATVPTGTAPGGELICGSMAGEREAADKSARKTHTGHEDER